MECLANRRQYVLEHGAITQIDLGADLHTGRERMHEPVAFDGLVAQLHQCAITRLPALAGLGITAGFRHFRCVGTDMANQTAQQPFEFPVKGGNLQSAYRISSGDLAASRQANCKRSLFA